MSRTKKKEGAVRGKTTNRIINILLVLGCLTILFPLYMTVIIAFKKPSEMTNDVAGALAFPQKWSFENFAEAMRVTDFWHSLGNSLLITGVTVVLCILIHSLAGYLIGRKMKQRKIFKISYYYIVSGMFVPFAVLMMPLVKETAQLGIANRFGVIVLYVVFFMPMNVLLYSGYLNNIPMALEEAACVDGAGVWQTYWKIVFPLLKPTIATVAIIDAMAFWNDYLLPSLVLGRKELYTLPIATQAFYGTYSTDLGLVMAALLLAMLPILVLYLFLQRYIVEGVTSGAVKG